MGSRGLTSPPPPTPPPPPRPLPNPQVTLPSTPPPLCHPRSRFPPLPLCGAYPFVGYCGYFSINYFHQKIGRGPPSAAVWSMPLCRVLWFVLNKLLSPKKKNGTSAKEESEEVAYLLYLLKSQVSDQVIREDPAVRSSCVRGRGTETSAEVLVGPPWRM